MSNGSEDHEDLIDMKIIESRRSLDSDLLVTIIQMYKEDAPELILLIRSLFEKNNLSDLSEAAHKLKGMSANVGALKVQQFSYKIEQQSKQNTVEGIDEIIQDLDNCYKQTIMELEKLVT